MNAPKNSKALAPTTTIREAPKPAPADIPSVYGLERGLSKIVCMPAPAIPNEAPTIRAIMAVGNRIDQIMTYAFFETSDGFINAAHTSCNVSDAGPTMISVTKLTAQISKPITINKSFR